MELIVVTAADYFEGEGALINEFFAGGLQLLHVRKPENNPIKFRKLMAEILPANYSHIVIHQHHDLAAEFSLKRLHFTEMNRKELPHGKMKMLAAAGFKLSSSVHELNSLAALADLDYVFFGPVFNSISKSGYNSILEPGFIVPPHAIKVFAIGGVNAQKLAAVKKMNFDGAAVLGAIWHQPVSPVMALKKIIRSIHENLNEHR